MTMLVVLIGDRRNISNENVSVLLQEKKARLEDMYDDFGRLKKQFRKGELAELRVPV